MLPETTFDTGEIALNYAEGPDTGAPLVVLHGLTGRWQDLQAVISPLLGSWHVYACDHRGHGKSGWARSGYRFVDYVPDTAAFIERRIGRPVVLLGWSLGGMVSLALAARHPELVRALILLDPPVYLREISIRDMPDPYNWFSWVYDVQTTARSHEVVAARCREFLPDLGEAEIQRVTETIRGVDPEAPATALREQNLDGLDLDATLRSISCPTLLLHGEPERGSALRAADVAYVAATVARCVVAPIAGAGHALHEKQPAQLLEHIGRFLDQL